MTLPDWMTSIVVLWTVILVLALVIIVLVVLLVAMKVNEARVLALIRDTENLLKAYVRESIQRTDRWSSLATALEDLQRLQDVDRELVDLMDLAGDDSTILAMGGPDLPDLDVEAEPDEQ